MKGKWTKILLIINMFLCLFGIHEFSNKANVVSEAFNSPRYLYIDVTAKTDATFIHYWKGTTNNGWPGKNIDKDNDSLLVSKIKENGTTKYYKFLAPAIDGFIINTGSSAWQTGNIEGYNLDDYNEFRVDSSKGVHPSTHSQHSNEFSDTYKSVYIEFASSIPSPFYIHMWNDVNGTETVWPGVNFNSSSNYLINEKKLVKNSVYELKIPSNVTRLIFNDNGSHQTDGNGLNCHTYNYFKFSSWTNVTSSNYVNSYTVTFKSETGAIIKTETYSEGANITFPTNPTKTSTAQYSYSFKGWRGNDNSFVNVLNLSAQATKNIVYTPEFEQTTRSYSVTYHYGLDGTKSNNQTLLYGTNILSKVPSNAQEIGYNIAWYFEQSHTTLVTSSSIVNNNISVYAVYTPINYNIIILDLGGFSGWSFANSYFDMYYSSTGKNSETYSSILNKKEIISLDNNFYEFKIDKDKYSSFVIRANSGSKQSEKINLLTDSSTNQKTKYVKLTNVTSSTNIYKIKVETELNNLLKTQLGILNSDKMYRFTMGATSDALPYGFEFIFIKNPVGSTPANSNIRYWNFSNKSMLTQVRLETLYKANTAYDGVTYKGFYSLTITESTPFITTYDRVLVLACCKDTNGVNVLKAVEYKINSDGSLTRVV